MSQGRSRFRAAKTRGYALPIPRLKSQGSWVSGWAAFDEIDFAARSLKIIRRTRPGR